MRDLKRAVIRIEAFSGLNRKEFCEKVGMSRYTYYKILRKKTRKVNPIIGSALLKFCEEVGLPIDIDDFIRGKKMLEDTIEVLKGEIKALRNNVDRVSNSKKAQEDEKHRMVLVLVVEKLNNILKIIEENS
jgi:transcriptional regulator with XRE-family HTH domain